MQSGQGGQTLRALPSIHAFAADQLRSLVIRFRVDRELHVAAPASPPTVPAYEDDAVLVPELAPAH